MQGSHGRGQGFGRAHHEELPGPSSRPVVYDGSSLPQPVIPADFGPRGRRGNRAARRSHYHGPLGNTNRTTTSNRDHVVQNWTPLHVAESFAEQAIGNGPYVDVYAEQQYSAAHLEMSLEQRQRLEEVASFAAMKAAEKRDYDVLDQETGRVVKSSVLFAGDSDDEDTQEEEQEQQEQVCGGSSHTHSSSCSHARSRKLPEPEEYMETAQPVLDPERIMNQRKRNAETHIDGAYVPARPDTSYLTEAQQAQREKMYRKSKKRIESYRKKCDKARENYGQDGPPPEKIVTPVARGNTNARIYTDLDAVPRDQRGLVAQNISPQIGVMFSFIPPLDAIRLFEIDYIRWFFQEWEGYAVQAALGKGPVMPYFSFYMLFCKCGLQLDVFSYETSDVLLPIADMREGLSAEEIAARMERYRARRIVITWKFTAMTKVQQESAEVRRKKVSTCDDASLRTQTDDFLRIQCVLDTRGPWLFTKSNISATNKQLYTMKVQLINLRAFWLEPTRPIAP